MHRRKFTIDYGRIGVIPHLRWYIAGLLCLATSLNYLDRQALSVLAHTIQQELHLSSVGYSYVTASFLISYTVMYAVSGRIVDYLGTRRSFTVFVSGWSVADMLHALANSAWQLAVFRFLLGAAEPANFPAGVRAVAEWFPVRERALAVGVFNAGTAVGAALAAPVVSGIAIWWGWRSAFVVTGALGFVWLALWALLYHPPQTHPLLSQAERELIFAGTAAEEKVHHIPSMRALLSMKETWGCIFARMLIDPVSYFLAFWIPKYLQEIQGFSIADIGMYGWIPFFALGVGNIAGGAIPRYLESRGWTVNRARKTNMLVISCFIPVCCLLLMKAASPALALILLGGLMFGHAAWANITLPAEVFPKEAVGTVTGFGGALGGVCGVLTQLSIGWVVQNLSFAPVFAACSAAYLVALILVHRLVPELGVIRKI